MRLGGLGVAKRCLDLATSYAKQRVTFGAPLADRQAVQFMIVDSAIDIRAARLMVYETACLYDQGQDARNASYMAKIFCTEMASRVVDRAIQKKLRGGRMPSTVQERARLYQFLMRQGFSPAAVSAAMKRIGAPPEID